ncbi:cell wall-binding repeat-containing protein [Egibacter rhizosphaerae]|uniref:Cell wall-binding repeat-containing protein n=1 Tax=Egibacter rhizosphaerae TaxID=1670831 RepID=A0A411YHL4_9ACTN|nr:cell wall-binding repeat-containing protein [Egibacter rhizosphaerae]QBI20825.1 cell wall-binding repeat-containing protein [Egibacter rhizosphaerae]
MPLQGGALTAQSTLRSEYTSFVAYRINQEQGDGSGTYFRDTPSDGGPVTRRVLGQAEGGWFLQDLEGGALVSSAERVAMRSHHAGLTGRPEQGSTRAGLLALVVGALTLLGLAPSSVELARTEGADRVATAVSVSESNWSSADTVLLATAWDYPDALAAAVLAATEDAPLLLANRDGLPQEVVAELQRLDSEEVLLLGGEATLPAAVEDELAALGLTTRRIAGADRFATAAEAARMAGAQTGEAALASGRDFPDAVSAGALAATPEQLPVLLTEEDSLPAVTEEALVDLQVERIHVVGGEAVVHEAVVRELEGLDILVERHAGAGRYATSVAVADEALSRHDDSVPLVLATGEAFPDALAAGALAARRDGVLVLTPRDGNDDDLEGFLRDHAGRWAGGEVLGGEAAISAGGLERLAAAAADAETPTPVADLLDEGVPDGLSADDPFVQSNLPLPVPSTYEGRAPYPYTPGPARQITITANVTQQQLVQWWVARSGDGVEEWRICDTSEPNCNWTWPEVSAPDDHAKISAFNCDETGEFCTGRGMIISPESAEGIHVAFRSAG